MIIPDREEKTYRIAVYGSLRKGLGNHFVIRNGTLIGSFWTPPEYTMWSNNFYPSVDKRGNTSVLMEVYECNAQVNYHCDRLEGYSGPGSYYDKLPIDTPFGPASCYLTPLDQRTVEEGLDHGDWYLFKQGVPSPHLVDKAEEE